MIKNKFLLLLFRSLDTTFFVLGGIGLSLLIITSIVDMTQSIIRQGNYVPFGIFAGLLFIMSLIYHLTNNIGGKHNAKTKKRRH